MTILINSVHVLEHGVDHVVGDGSFLRDWASTFTPMRGDVPAKTLWGQSKAKFNTWSKS